MFHTARLAAIVLDQPGGVDDLLASFALSLRDRGWCVRGVVQSSMRSMSGNMYPAVVDLDSGHLHPLYYYDQGRSSAGNETGMFEMLALFRRIVCEGADLVLMNRFSVAEAEGQGVTAEMMLLAQDGIPLLTVVERAQFPAWQAFAGDAGLVLPPSMERLNNWIFSVWREASAAASAAILETECRPSRMMS